jgi:DNA polymerase-3 subunit epsilon
MRQIILDTETTGLDPREHRVIEIGALELVNRRPSGRRFHEYLNPDREIAAGAIEVHGITNDFLADKPRFAEVAEALLAFISGAELIIHNAPFDVGFLDAELARVQAPPIAAQCSVLDTLALARSLHPGQKNSLDALCRRYGVDNSQRSLHGALLDAEILADVYLAMTGGQATLALDDHGSGMGTARAQVTRRLDPARTPLVVLHASAEESTAHEARLAAIAKAAGGPCLWQTLEAAVETPPAAAVRTKRR